MEEIWQRFKAWLKVNAPQVLEQLQPGASDAQIAELEKFINAKLPEDVKASYRICNGQTSDFGLIDGRELLSIENIKREWEVWKELLDTGDFQDESGRDYGSETEAGSGICPLFWWNPKWIPLTHDGGGNHDCLDLNPTEEGKAGQVITMWHDDPERTVIASSFQLWLQHYVEGLEAGLFVFDPNFGNIIDINNVV